MTALLSLTAPIFLLVALGFASVRAGWVEAAFIRGLGRFVLDFALPALVLGALVRQDLRQTFDAAYLAVYAGASLLVFALIFVLLRRFLRRDVPRASIGALGSVASNSGFIGFPLASLAVGAPALTALPLTMVVENVLVIPLALALAEAGQHGGKPVAVVLRDTALRLARTPLVVAIAVGVLLSTLGLHPPAPLATAVRMLADASAACALFVVGGTLAALDAQSRSADLGFIVAGKLALHPLAVAGGFALFGATPPGLAAAGILLASAPMLASYPIFGQRFGLGGLCAAALLAATVAGFLTTTAVVGLLPAEGRQVGRVLPEQQAAPVPAAPRKIVYSAAWPWRAAGLGSPAAPRSTP